MYYKTPDNKIHFIGPEHAYLLPAGSVQITEYEADEIRALDTPVTTQIDPLDKLKAFLASNHDVVEAMK